MIACTSSIIIYKARRGVDPGGPLHRHALLQSRPDDGAARTDPGPANFDDTVAGRLLPETGQQGADHSEKRPGFAVNRILLPVINEAIFALQEEHRHRRGDRRRHELGCNHPTIGPWRWPT